MTIEAARRLIEAAGFGSSIDAGDDGRVNVHDWDDEGRRTKIVGFALIRDGRIDYAEHRGQTFSFWPSSTDAERDARELAWRAALAGKP